MADVVTSTVTWPNYSSSNTVSSTTGNSELGKEAFLQLLITQLSNQDPLNPTNDTEFIAQMSQFSSLEQLINISEQLDTMSQSLGAVSGLIGKQVTWTAEEDDSDLEYSVDGENNNTSTTQTGIVDSIIVRDGLQYAKVGDSEVLLTDIIQMEESSESTDGEDASE